MDYSIIHGPPYHINSALFYPESSLLLNVLSSLSLSLFLCVASLNVYISSLSDISSSLTRICLFSLLSPTYYLKSTVCLSATYLFLHRGITSVLQPHDSLSSFQPTWIQPFFTFLSSLHLDSVVSLCHLSPPPLSISSFIFLVSSLSQHSHSLHLLIVLSILFKTHPSGKQFRKLSKQHIRVLAGFSQRTEVLLHVYCIHMPL